MQHLANQTNTHPELSISSSRKARLTETAEVGWSLRLNNHSTKYVTHEAGDVGCALSRLDPISTSQVGFRPLNPSFNLDIGIESNTWNPQIHDSIATCYFCGYDSVAGLANCHWERIHDQSNHVDQDFIQPLWSPLVPQEPFYPVTNEPSEVALPSTAFVIDPWANENSCDQQVQYHHAATGMNNGQPIHVTDPGFGSDNFPAGDLIDNYGVASLQQISSQAAVIGAECDSGSYSPAVFSNDPWKEGWIQGSSTQALPAQQSIIDQSTIAYQTTTIDGFPCAHVGCNKVFRRDADRIRHETTIHGVNPGLHFCPIAGCDKSLGFGTGYSRADKVKEHLWKKHANLGYVKGRM